MSSHDKIITLCCACVILFGCAATRPLSVPPQDVSAAAETQTTLSAETKTVPSPTDGMEAPQAPPSPDNQEPLSQSTTPRVLASLSLNKQAQLLLDENKPDDAIRILEQAIILSPGRGENYYYLAEAWFMKGNSSQAKEYNALAQIRFKDDPVWLRQIERQKSRIDGNR